MSEICQRCGEAGEDRRTLWMSCGYQMKELELPFYEQKLFETIDPRDDGFKFFTLLVCKRCRSDWLHYQRMWFHIPLPIHGEEGSGIFIRDFGYTREIAEETFRKMYPDREPVRLKKDNGE